MELGIRLSFVKTSEFREGGLNPPPLRSAPAESTAIHRLLTNSDISESHSFFLMSLTISTLAYHSTLKMEKAFLWKHWCLYARLHGVASHRNVAFTVNVDFLFLYLV
jgi:hypothetical protein